eukprot:m.49187 g.49187  ORF g.49187 m.49187 type:complete len:416 (+) comp13347_c0_seq2:111-1358(+)
MHLLSTTLLFALLLPANLTPSSFPSFLIGVGCQKCGTTALHRYLAGMPWTGTAGRKEVHFFDKHKCERLIEETNVSYALQSYLNRWGPDHRTAPVLFEFSPKYMYERHAPHRMAQVFGSHLKDIRFLMVLRNPARRAFSGLFQQAPKLNASVFDVSAIGEMNVLLDCYNHGLSMGLPSMPRQPAAPDDSYLVQTPSGLKRHSGAVPTHVTPVAVCTHPDRQYTALKTCLDERTKMTGDQSPWFKRDLTNHFGSGSSKQAPYNGHLLRGIYVDQLRNMLCAGIQPNQIMIVSSNTLYHDQLGVLGRIAQWLNQSLPTADDVSEKVINQLTNGIVSNTRSFRHGSPDPTVMTRLDRFLEPFNDVLLHLVASLPFHANVTALSLELDRNRSHPVILKGRAKVMAEQAEAEQTKADITT